MFIYYVDQDGYVKSFKTDSSQPEHLVVSEDTVYVCNDDMEVVGEFTAWTSLMELAKAIEG